MTKLLQIILLAAFTIPSFGETIKIGVLAKRGTEQCLQQWRPTAAYLAETIPDYRFEIIPLNFDEIFSATEQGHIDFVLANSAIYVELAVRYKVARIATLNNQGPNDFPHAVFGGTVFSLKTNTASPDWQELKGSRVAAVDPTSFGGWLAALRELQTHGLKPGRDFHVEFTGTHDDVVQAVRSGNADFGIVRTDTLERMAEEGTIALENYSVLPCPGDAYEHHDQFMYRHSTRLYPEWTIAKTHNTPNALVQKVAIQLLQMHPDSEAARGAFCAGWIVPLDYNSVTDCLQELHVRPFEDFGKVTLAEAMQQHKAWIFALLALLTGLLFEMRRLYSLNNQLKLARKVADSATLAKSQFVANMSHEIRTPMNAVIGMTDLLMTSEMTAEQKEFTHIIRTSGDSLMAVVNNILDFSRIEAGCMEIEQQDFDLVQCLEDALDVVSCGAAEKNVEVVYELDGHVPAIIRGDNGRLKQVLLNLLSNAVKFTANGEVGVRITAAPTNHGHRIEFAVHDTGIGIEPEKLDEIFNAFTQADISTTRRFGGTGLGLYISQSLCKLMGGTLRAESTPGQGSVFYCTILATTSGKAQPVFAGQKPFDLENNTVLVVDDNLTNLKILCAQLVRWNLTPIAFDSPFEALKSVRGGKQYGLMISDMQMPDMDGTMLIREIRQTCSSRELPVILLTSLGIMKPDPVLGIAATLVKPAKPQQLYTRIGQILRNRKIEADKARQAHPPTQFASLNILVVEDNKLNQIVALRMLDKIGCTADLATDGLEALECVGQKHYDVVLMDIQMPNMDGLTATREIHKRFQDQPRPLIFALTAHASREDRELGMAAGMDDYITKPIQLVKLKTVIQNVYETRTELLKIG